MSRELQPGASWKNGVCGRLFIRLGPHGADALLGVSVGAPLCWEIKLGNAIGPDRRCIQTWGQLKSYENVGLLWKQHGHHMPSVLHVKKKKKKYIYI